MSISVYIVARKNITEDDRKLIEAYNACMAVDIEPPQDLIDQLIMALGADVVKDAQDNGRFCITENDKIEIDLYYKVDGDVMYDDGAIVRLSDLPSGTVEIRVYTEA